MNKNRINIDSYNMEYIELENKKYFLKNNVQLEITKNKKPIALNPKTNKMEYHLQTKVLIECMKINDVYFNCVQIK